MRAIFRCKHNFLLLLKINLSFFASKSGFCMMNKLRASVEQAWMQIHLKKLFYLLKIIGLLMLYFYFTLYAVNTVTSTFVIRFFQSLDYHFWIKNGVTISSDKKNKITSALEKRGHATKRTRFCKRGYIFFLSIISHIICLLATVTYFLYVFILQPSTSKYKKEFCAINTLK